jgi:RNA polymerase sigma-70 factor (ECF subfamily)
VLPIESYKNYLLFLASIQFPAALKGKVDPLDLVQLTLLKAHESRGEFRGTTDAQCAAWLRRILANVTTDAVRKHAPRLGPRERSFHEAIEQSAQGMEALLEASASTPSQRMIREEQLVRLADAIARLPDDQRQAINLRHLEGLPTAVIAERMDKTVAAVGGLLQRGLRALRTELGES